MTDQTTETATQQQETVTKHKNPLRIEQGKKLVGYNRRKKEELKRLNEQITKQDSIDRKPRSGANSYVYVGGLSLLGLAIGSYLLYSKLQNQKKIFSKCSKNFYRIIYKWLKLYERFKRECLSQCGRKCFSHWLHNAWKNVSKDEPSISR